MLGYDRPGTVSKQLSAPLLGAQGARASRKDSSMEGGYEPFREDEQFLNQAYYKDAAKRFYRYDGTLWRATLVPELTGFVLWPWGLITAWCLLLTAGIEFFQLTSVGNMPATVHTVLGGALSFLLVFRTNTAYARWWEARLTWGVINNTSRALAAQAAATMKTHAALTQLITELLAFVVCLKSLLRGKPTVPEELGTMLTHEQLQLLNDAVCPPIAAVEALSRTLRTGVRTTDEGGLLAGTTYLHLSQSLNDLVNAVGACERLVNTNTPYGYVSALRSFMIVWLVTLPFTLIGTYVWSAVAAVSLVAFFFISIENMAMEIEHPFGDDPNDLPLEEYCLGIERVLLDILKRAQRPSSTASSGAAAMPAFAEEEDNEYEDEPAQQQQQQQQPRRPSKFVPRPGAPSLDDSLSGRVGAVKQTAAATSSPGGGPGLRPDSKSIPLPEGSVPTPPKPRPKKMSILEQKRQAERAMNEAKALLAEQDDEM